jgi:squalene-hopene/tetraprenyl-beta-curcumene cyclase
MTTQTIDEATELRPGERLAADGWYQLARESCRFLLREAKNDFSEAGHVMPFPKEQGFTADQEMQCGDIFQRAIIADAMSAAARAGICNVDELIDREIGYLVSKRITSDPGGWKYFPCLPELPPDADDLAQVIILLHQSGRHDLIADYCTRPLEVLLSEGVMDDGGIETWILPKEGNREQALQLEWARKAWGTGADVDVMANLLYALHLLDEVKYKTIIQAGTDYIIRRQQANGTWEATWYFYHHYTAYICNRLIGLVCPGADALRKSVAHTLNCDFAWTAADNVFCPTTALGTALSILAAPAAVLTPIQLNCLLVFMARSGNEKMGWPASDFIKMQLGRPSGRVHDVLGYGSRTITTAFVLKAALKIYTYLNKPEPL